MDALWPVFGLLVLVAEWVVLRRMAPGMRVRSVLVGAAIGGAVGLGMSVALAVLGVVLVWVAGVGGLDAGATEVLRVAGSVMFITGFLFTPVAAAFGALLLGVERWRVGAPEAPASRGD